MSKLNTSVLVIVTLVCGAGAFFVSRSMAVTEAEQTENCQCRWLEGESSDTVSLENKFNSRIEELSQKLGQERNSLAELFADAQTDNESITQQAESVIIAQENLISSVAEHVTSLRGKLSAEQRSYFMDMCASSIRGPMRRGNRHGNGSGNGKGNGNGNGYRGGRNSTCETECGDELTADISAVNGMRGPGKGRRIAEKLALDDEQMANAAEKDPGFDEQCREYCMQLTMKRGELLAAFENDQASNDEILRKTDELIKAHTTLERRIISHILILRPFLTGEQQRLLVGLCGSCPGKLR